MIAGLSRIHLIDVIGMNLAHTRRFVTANLEPEATVIAPYRIQHRQGQQRKATARTRIAPITLTTTRRSTQQKNALAYPCWFCVIRVIRVLAFALRAHILG